MFKMPSVLCFLLVLLSSCTMLQPRAVTVHVVRSKPVRAAGEGAAWGVVGALLGQAVQVGGAVLSPWTLSVPLVTALGATVTERVTDCEVHVTRVVMPCERGVLYAVQVVNAGDGVGQVTVQPVFSRQAVPALPAPQGVPTSE